MRGEVNPIRDEQINAVLDRLHKRARAELPGLLAGFAFESLKRLVVGRPKDGIGDIDGFYRGEVIPIDRAQGHLIYLLCRRLGARRVVEFGTSLGVSALYLAAAVRDNGGGIVIGTEIDPEKAAAARANFKEAGVSELVDLREGDALTTLKDCGGPVDFLLLDGWAHLALPITELMTPQLRQGAIVVSDNVGQFPKGFAAFTSHIRAPESGFVSTLLPLRGGTELAVRV